MIDAGDMSKIQSHIMTLGKEVRSMIKSAFELSYFSRGAWSYQDVLQMCAAEREMALEFINKRLEIAGNCIDIIFGKCQFSLRPLWN